MKNLENYGVQEMNAKEIRNTDGGEYDDICFFDPYDQGYSSNYSWLDGLWMEIILNATGV